MHHTYKSSRAKAWRNAMVAVINAGLERRLFTLADKQNLWPGADDSANRDDGKGHVFTFEVSGIPAVAYVNDAGWNELRVQVALWPTADGERWIRSVANGNAAWLAGDLIASGWLERETGLYLMEGGGRGALHCRPHRVEAAAAISISPNGYADHGRFIL